MVRGWYRLQLTLLAVGYLAVALFYNALQPIFEAPEEPANVEYVRYLELHHRLPSRLPTTHAATPPSRPGGEFVQVPLYYALLAVLLSTVWLPPGARWHRNPFVTWPNHPYRYAVAFHRSDEGWPYRGLGLFVHLARVVSGLLGLLAVFATYALVLQLTGRQSDALVGAAWFAFSPAVLLASSRVNNDAAAMAFSTVSLFLAARYVLRAGPASWCDRVGISAALAASLLSKLDTAFLVPLVAAFVLLRNWPRYRSGVPWWRGLPDLSALILPPLAAVAAWWLLVGHTYGRRLGQQVGSGVLDVGNVAVHADWSRLPDAVATLASTWWGSAQFDEQIRWPPLVAVVVGLPTAVLLAANLAAFGKQHRWTTSVPQAGAAVLLLALAAASLIYAALARQITPGIGYAAHARFVLPAAPVVALLVSLGRRQLPTILSRWCTAACLAGVLSVAVATPIVLFPRINPPAIPARLAATPAEASAPALASARNGIEILRVSGLPGTLRPGRTMPVELLWRVARAPGEDFTVSLQVTTMRGERVSGIDAVPHATDFPPRYWQPGELIDETERVPIPSRLAPGSYSLRISLYQRDRGDLVSIPLTAAGSAPGVFEAGSWRVLPDTTALTRLTPLAADFGNELFLSGFELAPGNDGIRVSLLWDVRDRIGRRLVVSVQVLSSDGRLIAQSDGEPVGGLLPTTVWIPGDRVRDDHGLALSTIPRGGQIILVAYDRQTLQRLPVLRDGVPIADHVVLVSP